MPNLVHLVLLNELTLPWVLWSVVRKRRLCLIEAPAVVPRLAPLLARVHRWLVRRKLAQRVDQLDPGLAKFQDIKIPRHVHDTFAVVEPWMEREFLFESARRLGDDAVAYRLIACNHILEYFNALFYMDQLASADKILVGGDRILSGLYRALHGRPTGMVEMRPWIPAQLLNVLTLAGLSIAAFIAALASIRPRVAAKEIFLGTDFSGDRRDPILWRETAESGKTVMVVFRNPVQAARHGATLAHPWINAGDGNFSATQGLAAAFGCIRRGFVLGLFAVGLPNALFFRLASLPYKRMLAQRMLAVHRFRYFWCRDDYNVEHILRNQELRKQGGRSLGVAHGLPIASIILPMWRYIDCDVYYVLGRHILRYYGDKWSSKMIVRAGGSLGLERRHLPLLDAPRPPDIIFSAKPGRTADQLVKIAALICDTFLNRIIYLHLKPGFDKTLAGKDFIARVTARRSNVRLTGLPIYELFLKARYLIADPSTVGAEAIQFGLASFILDIDDRKTLIFRDFPDLCVRSGHEAVDRIRAIEAGTWTYPREKFEPLVALHRRTVQDMVREDLGLPPYPTSTSEAAA